MRRSDELITVVLVLVGGLGLFGCGKSNSTVSQTAPDSTGSANRMGPSLDATDMEFVQNADMGGVMEVELGKLAQQNAASQSVKDFGQRMVEDHTKANQDLRQVATEKNIVLPSSLDDKHTADWKRLAKLRGRPFDQAYMKDMVQDHKEDVAEFERASQNAQDADVKAFATRTLPALQSHLQLAQQVDEKLR
jgi:putative membrane protein